MVAKGWSDAQKRAYVIADNKLARTRLGRGAAADRTRASLQALGFDLAADRLRCARDQARSAGTAGG